MADNDRISKDESRDNSPEVDQGDLTPPHGDELRSEETFGRTDRYATKDDPDGEPPVLDTNAHLVPEEELSADARRRRMEQIDDAAADEARMATRKRQHSAD
jgi:hypothetical protein